MKKLLALVLLVSLSLLAACNSNKENNQVNTSENTSQNASSTQEDKSQTPKTFPAFTAKDFKDNDVDESVFKDKKLTLVNFWFTGCKPCIDEMPYLGELSKKLEENGMQLIGVCADADKEPYLTDAKKIVEDSGTDFRQMVFNGGDIMNGFLGNIMAFPTTYIVDGEGNIISEPLIGTLDQANNAEKINYFIEQYKNAN